MTDYMKLMMEGINNVDGASQATEAQKQVLEIQQQMMNIQQQTIAAGGMTSELMQQLVDAQQKMMETALGNESASYGIVYDDEDDAEEQAIAEFISTHPQPKELVKYLGVGCFFMVMRGEPVSTIEMMGAPDDYIAEIESSWDITDGAGLTDMIESLLSGRAYHKFNDTYLAIKSGNTDDINDDDIENYHEALEGLRDIVEISPKDINKCPSILAWDLERAAFLARAGAHIGYITKNQAWCFVKAAAIEASKHFAEWKQYGISVVMGRTVHMGYNENYIYAMEELLEETPDFLNRHPLKDM